MADKGLPNAESLPRDILNLPMHPYLGGDDQAYIMATIAEALG